MRCMMCGDDMVLTHAVPAEAGGVQGFETQTHQCPACLGTERRFIFVGAKTDFIEGATAKGARAYAIKRSLNTLMAQTRARCIIRVQASSSLQIRLKRNLVHAMTGRPRIPA